MVSWRLPSRFALALGVGLWSNGVVAEAPLRQRNDAQPLPHVSLVAKSRLIQPDVVQPQAVQPQVNSHPQIPSVEPDDVPLNSGSTPEPNAPSDKAPTASSPNGIIDIREPDSTANKVEKALKKSVEPSWLNDVVDENAALWRESTDVMEIIPNGNRGFGLTTLGFNSIWKSENAPGVWVVPRFGWTFASGPDTPNVQAQLYDLRLEMNVAQPLNDIWTVHLQLAPAFVTDWNNKSSDAFRLIGGGMLAAHVSEELTFIGGVLALSRFDLPILPLGGVRWHPTPWLEVDALFPNPHLAWRYKTEADGSHWLYMGGQLGGNQWAVDHATSDHDKLGYRDYRVLIGCETRMRDGNRSLFEIGYVFDRQLKFSNGLGNQQSGETLVIRWGSRF